MIDRALASDRDMLTLSRRLRAPPQPLEVGFASNTVPPYLIYKRKSRANYNDRRIAAPLEVTPTFNNWSNSQVSRLASKRKGATPKRCPFPHLDVR
jgi:hypothetical protein